jgi:hypothetical protein
MARRTRVVWKWEDETDDGEAVGPVWVDYFDGDTTTPERSEEWGEWVSRSEAQRFAEENGYEFLADG